MSKIPLLVLAGPTAVGKSELAMCLARKLNCAIISADSAQVYRYMDIGTAKPTEAERQEIKHYLIDLVNPDQYFSAADYQKAARQAINEQWSAGKIPFMVGGTGLYIRAVISSYAFGRQGASGILRKQLEKEADQYGLNRLFEKLQKLDPATADIIHPNDRRRIIRALEVYTLEGRPISDQVKKTNRDNSPYHTLFYCLNCERDLLYERINGRVNRMLEAGFLHEVKSLYLQGYDLSAPGMQILGYRQLLEYLGGERSWEDTVEEIKKQTRNLAKRQLTWFRGEKDVNWLNRTGKEELCEEAEIIYNRVKELLP